MNTRSSPLTSALVVLSTTVPLICSGLFIAANGQFPVRYIDALFNCVSAMTVTGIATVDLSSLTVLQQVLLFGQMCVGSPVRTVQTL